MKQFEAQTTIAASPQTVWRVLTETSAWPEWDPSCEKIEGTLSEGAKIKAFSTLSPGRAFKLKVTELDEPKQMTWSGGMPLGLFKGVRTFTLSAEDEGTTFVVREVFSGPMLALIGGSLPDMTEAFQGFVDGLKQRSEAAVS